MPIKWLDGEEPIAR